MRSLKPKGVKTVALWLESTHATPANISAIAEVRSPVSWDPDKYKTDPKKNEKLIESFALLSRMEWPTAKHLNEAGSSAKPRISRERSSTSRANKLTPSVLAEKAKTMAETIALNCEVLDREAMEELGMGALLGVAQGSINPPFLIVLKYRPYRRKATDHLALVGKGVTFDTGGISIKPADGMEKMKYDMAGAAAVIGAMQAISQLKPSIPVPAYVPTVENAC